MHDVLILLRESLLTAVKSLFCCDANADVSDLSRLLVMYCDCHRNNHKNIDETFT